MRDVRDFPKCILYPNTEQKNSRKKEKKLSHDLFPLVLLIKIEKNMSEHEASED